MKRTDDYESVNEELSKFEKDHTGEISTIEEQINDLLGYDRPRPKFRVINGGLK
jgi:hypothetical protein